MGSYLSRQIADLVLLLSELTFFSNYDTSALFIFCRYIDDGFMSQTTSLTFPPHILHKFPSLSPPTVIPLTTLTSQFHSIITPSCITKFTTAFTKSHTTNTCTQISHQIIHNSFSQGSLKLKLYDTADRQRLSTAITLYTNYLHYD